MYITEEFTNAQKRNTRFNELRKEFKGVVRYSSTRMNDDKSFTQIFLVGYPHLQEDTTKPRFVPVEGVTSEQQEPEVAEQLCEVLPEVPGTEVLAGS